MRPGRPALGRAVAVAEEVGPRDEAPAAVDSVCVPCPSVSRVLAGFTCCSCPTVARYPLLKNRAPISFLHAGRTQAKDFHTKLTRLMAKLKAVNGSQHSRTL